MSGGKGGGEQKTEMDPDFKRAGLDAIETGKQLSKMSPIPYMGLVQAAPSQATRQAWTNVNDSANLLGLGMEGDPSDGLPEHEHHRVPEWRTDLEDGQRGLDEPAGDVRG